jgi:hypothetical protein
MGTDPMLIMVLALQQMRRDGRKIAGVVAWDYQMAQIVDRAGAARRKKPRRDSSTARPDGNRRADFRREHRRDTSLRMTTHAERRAGRG